LREIVFAKTVNRGCPEHVDYIALRGSEFHMTFPWRRVTCHRFVYILLNKALESIEIHKMVRFDAMSEMRPEMMLVATQTNLVINSSVLFVSIAICDRSLFQVNWTQKRCSNL